MRLDAILIALMAVPAAPSAIAAPPNPWDSTSAGTPPAPAQQSAPLLACVADRSATGGKVSPTLTAEVRIADAGRVAIIDTTTGTSFAAVPLQGMNAHQQLELTAVQLPGGDACMATWLAPPAGAPTHPGHAAGRPSSGAGE